MPVPMTVVPGSLPEGFCPNSEQERFNAYMAALTVTLPATASIINTGSNGPPTDQQSFPWIRVNSDQTPDRTYYYWNGAWVSLHPLVSGLVVAYPFEIGDINTFDGGEAGPVTPSSGPMWELLPGAGGRFIIGAGSSTGTSNFPVASTGGTESVTLTPEQQWQYTYGIGGSGLTDSGVAAAAPGIRLLIINGGTTPAAAHNNTPSYTAAYWIRRTYRSMYRL